ncbi:MAG: RluA family pseudouridine synthase [Actinomycetia bacterium]|jgi:23S rRNA pseudouridine1911/1915/1917 synthase|nr:RluA family pseudouridine synthase [Actinomycetes bacterium]
MKRTVEAEEGRLDVVVARVTGMPRADVQRAITAGTVRVDGEPREKSFRLRGGERLTIEIEADAPPEAEGPPVAVRYRDEHLAVVSKPAGLVTHPTASRRGGTLVNRLLGMGVPLAAAGGALRPGIVHRLDAGTSGLLVVAATDEAYGALRKLFHDHEVDRAYLAVVRGLVANDAFAVDAPLGRRASKIVVDATEGRRAETGFAVRERLESTTFLEATPRTGRTHQIRVHLAAIGHPILGDRAYGGGGDDARAAGLDRPFLHAWRLSFVHPLTGADVSLEEDLPPELVAALERLR